MSLTQDRLKELLHYDPETGVFTWAVKPARRIMAGSVAGANSRGHVVIRIDTVLHLAHRLVFLYVTGKWPEHHVDHINGVRDDNRWCNLRDVPPLTNVQNQRKAQTRSKTGVLGVSPHSTRKGMFVAFIGNGGATTNLGSYPTAELAQAAYLKAKREQHEGCTL